MADNLTVNPYVIDLTVTGARTLMPLPGYAKLSYITVSGNPGGTGTLTLTLRADAAGGSNPIVWQWTGTASVVNTLQVPFPDDVKPVRGLFLDTIANAWNAGSILLVAVE